MKKARAGIMSHGDKRHRMTTLFPALNVLDGGHAIVPGRW